MSTDAVQARVGSAFEKALRPIANVVVESVTPCEKPRVQGDLRILFTIKEGAKLEDEKKMLSVISSIAEIDGAPRSITTVSQGYVTHMKPSAEIFK